MGIVTASTGTYLIAVTGNFGTTARLDHRQTSAIHSTWAPVLVVPAVYCCPGKVYEPRPSGGSRRTAPAGAALGGLTASLRIYIMGFASIARDFPFGL